MDAEAMKARVRAYYQEIWSEGREARVDAWMSDDYENHDPATPGGCLRGRAAFKGLVRAFRAALPDLHMQIVEQHVAGSVVLSRWLASGTHQGELLGIAATGCHLAGVQGMTLTRFEGERICRDHALWDALGVQSTLRAAAQRTPTEGDPQSVVLRTFEELWNAHDPRAAYRLFAPTYVGRFQVLPAPLEGREALEAFAANYFAAFPDIHFTVDELLVSGERVMARWTAQGTQHGPLMGHPASSRPVSVAGVWILRVRAGLVVEQWGLNDTLGMLRQIGALPGR